MHSWTVYPLSKDHKPDLEDEKKRIEANNGIVDSYKGFMIRF